MIKILTVCLGNICRSPIAEELLRIKCSSLGLDVFVDSAGSADYHIGSAPDSRMIQTAHNFGCDISNLRARQFHISDFQSFDYIFTMDEDIHKNIRRLTSDSKLYSKVFSFQGFADIDNPSFVPDPYYGTFDDFVHTFNIVDLSASIIAKKLMKIHNT
jgi:protein-tyrosine phosphatase